MSVSFKLEQTIIKMDDNIEDVNSDNVFSERSNKNNFLEDDKNATNIPSNRNTVPRSIYELLSITLLSSPMLLLFLFFQGDPNERGYFCDDKSLKYPYKDEEISV